MTFGDEHVITPPELAEGLGGVVFVETFTLVDAVQLLAAVTIRLYVPPAFTTGLAVPAPLTIPGPLQLYVPPPVPVKAIFGLEQVMTPPELAPAVAGEEMHGLDKLSTQIPTKLPFEPPEPETVRLV